ncbi:NrfD/PsrC family molybdoenzyme membrane anchor subunit [Curtanaerobium respiraculi]|uniref:NrfD/PsrC family molybdoenzyme membrane anchor subunit n=1 Tax=Curtanaerobium respiraculi TaxID=2949669 RepID=UPI0024B34344|nr:NrfD/PsrC family molybdoenzyme membrane anchor subunit [Curtanaerobium respiraculi]
MLQTTWGALIGAYLFLGGMSAGAFATAGYLYLKDHEHHARIVCISMWASAICLGVGLLLLVFDLIHPIRGMQLWSAFSHWTTWMTYGAWGAFCAIIVFGLSALMATLPFSAWLAKKWNWYARRMLSLRKGFAIAGIALGVFVAVYTGMLLMTAEGVPLWDTPLLPCLFTVSAFDTGVALVEVVAVSVSKRELLQEWAHSVLEKAVIALVVAEVLVVVAFIMVLGNGNPSNAMSAAAAASVAMLTTGILAPYFWGMFILLGLGFPLVAALAGMTHLGKPAYPVMFIGAAGALVGGCELRFLILAAGVHADIVTATITSLI